MLLITLVIDLFLTYPNVIFNVLLITFMNPPTFISPSDDCIVLFITRFNTLIFTCDSSVEIDSLNVIVIDLRNDSDDCIDSFTILVNALSLSLNV